MIATLFLISLFYTGKILQDIFFKDVSSSVRIPGSFILGSLTGISLIFIASLILKSLLNGLVFYTVLFMIISFIQIQRDLTKVKKVRPDKRVVIYLFLFVIFYAIFSHSFSYGNNSFLISSNLYQDFGAHISFIRYFSSGNKIIPEVPFFAGGGLLYYFMFDFYASVLSFLGLRIDIALNLISALSFASLIIMLFEFSFTLVKNKSAAILSCVFLLFNSDLSFIQVINKYKYSIYAYYHHNTYLQGGLFGFLIDKNFLNINVFLNQRHLIFGLLWILYILYIVMAFKKLSTKQIIFLAFLISLFPFWHLSVLISAYLILFGMSVFLENKRIPILKILLISLVVVLPQLLIIKLHSQNTVSFYPGFLAAGNLTLQSFSALWLWNLGFSIPAAILGFFVSNKLTRHIVISFFILFIIANVFKFSPDIFDNHKFFNVWIISINILSALGIVYIFNIKKLRFLSLILVSLVCASGILHFLVVKNDVYAQIPDYGSSNIIKWVKEKTPSNSIFLTNGEIYDPANIAGLRTYIGRPQYIYLYGQNPDSRVENRKLVLNGTNKGQVVNIITSGKINYIMVYKTGFAHNLAGYNLKFLNSNFNKIYEDNQGIIFKI